jgi:hypothetical protein
MEIPLRIANNRTKPNLQKLLSDSSVRCTPLEAPVSLPLFLGECAKNRPLLRSESAAQRGLPGLSEEVRPIHSCLCCALLYLTVRFEGSAGAQLLSFCPKWGPAALTRPIFVDASEPQPCNQCATLPSRYSAGHRQSRSSLRGELDVRHDLL